MGPYCFYLLEDCSLHDIHVKKTKTSNARDIFVKDLSKGIPNVKE